MTYTASGPDWRSARVESAVVPTWHMANRLEWKLSRTSGVALVLADPDGCRFRLESQRNENERRDFASLAVCAAVLMGYAESRYIYARRIAVTLGGSYLTESLVGDESHPSYTEMRNFLLGELDARYVVACQAAFARVVFNNRLCRSAWRNVREAWHGRQRELCGAERGWL